MSGDDFTGALGRDTGENTGDHAITVGTLSAGSNYDLSLPSTPVVFAIAKAVLRVDANDKSKTYGDADPTLTYTLREFKSGEDPSSAGVDGTATCSLDPSAGPNTGTYDHASL